MSAAGHSKVVMHESASDLAIDSWLVAVQRRCRSYGWGLMAVEPHVEDHRKPCSLLGIFLGQCTRGSDASCSFRWHDFRSPRHFRQGQAQHFPCIEFRKDRWRSTVRPKLQNHTQSLFAGKSRLGKPCSSKRFLVPRPPPVSPLCIALLPYRRARFSQVRQRVLFRDVFTRRRPHSFWISCLGSLVGPVACPRHQARRQMLPLG